MLAHRMLACIVPTGLGLHPHPVLTANTQAYIQHLGRTILSPSCVKPRRRDGAASIQRVGDVLHREDQQV
jgi:hypothetical protein